MRKLFFCSLLLIVHFCNGQNYQCLQSGVKHYFTNGNYYLRGIRIDSTVVSGADTIYYPYRTIRSYPARDTVGSWLGGAVIQHPDGTFLFDDIWGDTVFIRTQAIPGNTWLLYSDTAIHTYIATLTSADTMSVLGTLDSVKKITINSFHAGIPDLSDPVNNFSIILSKNSGFVQVFDLYTFPYAHAGVSPSLSGIDFYLGNLCFPGTPNIVNSEFRLTTYHDPTQLEVFNFNVGDFFWGHTDVTDDVTGHPLYWDIHVDSVLSKSVIDPYHIQYVFNHRARGEHYYYNWGADTLLYTNSFPYSCCLLDTLIADTSALFQLVSMPEELGSDSLYYFNPHDDSLCHQSSIYISQYMPYGGPFEACPKITTYKVGFLPMHSISCNCAYGCALLVSPSYGIIETTLTYSSVDSISCGTIPLPLSEKNVVTPLDQLSLYPNPAMTTLTVSSPADINEISIINLLGQEIQTFTGKSQQIQVNIADLAQGIYLIKINRNTVRKFVKQ